MALEIISVKQHKKELKDKRHKLLAEIIVLQRDMAYKFIRNHGLDKKYSEWFQKNIMK